MYLFTVNFYFFFYFIYCISCTHCNADSRDATDKRDFFDSILAAVRESFDPLTAAFSAFRVASSGSVIAAAAAATKLPPSVYGGLAKPCGAFKENETGGKEVSLRDDLYTHTLKEASDRDLATRLISALEKQTNSMHRESRVERLTGN